MLTATVALTLALTVMGIVFARNITRAFLPKMNNKRDGNFRQYLLMIAAENTPCFLSHENQG